MQLFDYFGCLVQKNICFCMKKIYFRLVFSFKTFEIFSLKEANNCCFDDVRVVLKNDFLPLIRNEQKTVFSDVNDKILLYSERKLMYKGYSWLKFYFEYFLFLKKLLYYNQ